MAKQRKDAYHALQPMRLVRPHQIISGEVKLVPLGNVTEERRAISAGPRNISPIARALAPRRSLAGQQEFVAKPQRRSLVLPATGTLKKHHILAMEAGEVRF